MKKVKNLTFIYNYKNFQPQYSKLKEEILEGYYLVHCFDQDQTISREKLISLYEKNRVTSGASEIGPFQDQDDLLHYVKDVCSEVSCEEANILSVDEFNQLLENISNKSEIHSMVPRFGRHLSFEKNSSLNLKTLFN